jgi:hypothetical protein
VENAKSSIKTRVSDRATQTAAQMLADELWALLHGMASLYLDRFAPFDLTRITECRNDTDPRRSDRSKRSREYARVAATSLA